MKAIVDLFLLGVASASWVPASSSPAPTPVEALNRYCEPLLAGAPASVVTKAAKDAGFKDDRVGAQPVLITGELILSVSDSPRVCLIQAPASMSFEQGIALVDGWAARHAGAQQGAATKGPDGAPVKLWAVPDQKKYLLVTEQGNARRQKVVTFILAPLPGT